MTQTPHTATHWPLPMGAGVLIEIDFAQVKSDTITLLDGGLHNLSTARVRATSPYLPESIARELLPLGDASIGRQLVVAEATLRYLEPAEYAACGITLPNPQENGLGDLAFVNYDRIIAIMPEIPDTESKLPFEPLGGRVFFEYDLSDESDTLLEVSQSGLVMREKDVAVGNQMATVIGTGPKAEFVKTGDRIIVKRSSSSITFEGKRYFFVTSENDIFAVVREVA